MKGDDKKYEEQIRMTAHQYFFCCEKILFEDQNKRLPSSYKITLSNGNVIDGKSTVCTKCSSKLLIGEKPKNCIDNNLDWHRPRIYIKSGYNGT